MREFLKSRNGRRTATTSIGILAANFIVAILTEFGVPLAPDIVATGTLLLAAIINMLVSKYFD